MRETAAPCEPSIRLVPAAHGIGNFFLLILALILVFLLPLRLGAAVPSGAAKAPVERPSLERVRQGNHMAIGQLLA
jgi:hypothetical protein